MAAIILIGGWLEVRRAASAAFDGGYEASAAPQTTAPAAGRMGHAPQSSSLLIPATRAHSIALSSAAPPAVSSGPEPSPAQLDASPSAADGTPGPTPSIGVKGTIASLAHAGDPDAKAKQQTTGGNPKPQTNQPSWIQRAGTGATTTAWALGQFLGSGRWSREARLSFEHDARLADTQASNFDLARQSAQAGISFWNPQLVFGPNLILGRTRLDLAMLRDGYRIDGRPSEGSGRIVGYDFGLTATPAHRVIVDFFATRTQTVFPVLFGTSRDHFSTQHGASLRVTAPFLDSTFEYRQARSEAKSRTESSTLRDGEDRTTLSYLGTGQSEQHGLTIEYRREDRVDLVFPEFNYPLQFSNLRHSWAFDGGATRRSLTNTLAVSRRGGAMSVNYLRAESRLDYQLTPVFDTRVTYRNDRSLTRMFGRNQHAIDAQLQHRLYGSLVSTAAGRLSRDELRTGERQLHGATVRFDYRKRLIGGGRVTASVGRRWDYEDNRFSERQDAVLGEAHEARVGMPIRLRRERVAPSSLVVTDATGTILFRAGLDYDVDLVGEFAELRIRPDGRILDGATVLVDYLVQVSPFTVIDTTAPHYDVAVDYGWVNPYVRYGTYDRVLVRGFDDGSVFDSASRVEGINFRWNRWRTRVLLRNEHRTEDSRTLAFESLQLGQLVSFALGDGRVLAANIDETRINFRTPVRREDRVAGQLDFRWQLSPGLTLSTTAVARVRHDTVGFEERFYQAGAEAQWERNVLHVAVQVVRDWGEHDGHGFEGLRVGVRATRSF